MTRSRAAVVVAVLSFLSACSAFRHLEPNDVRHLVPQAQTQFVRVGNLDVRVADTGGSGEPLVLLHGLGGSLEVWDGWVAALAPSQRIIRLDLPGFGLTGAAPDRKYSVTRDADVVVQVLRHLGVKEYAVAGNSLGGYVAWYLAQEKDAKKPRVTKLILLAPIGLDAKPAFADRIPSPLRDLARIAVPAPLLRWQLRRVYGEDKELADRAIERAYDLARLPGNRGAAVDRLGSKWIDFTERLAHIDAPALLLWGSEDRWLSLDDACCFHNRIRNSQLVMLKGVGHLPMEQAPAQTAALAREFLDGKELTLPEGASRNCYDVRPTRGVPLMLHGHKMPALKKNELAQIRTLPNEFEGMRVFVVGTNGPPILLLHEPPGMTPESFAFARLLAARGYTIYMPLLFGSPGKHTTMRNFFSIVFGGHWHPFRANETPPIVGKLRRLAQHIHTIDARPMGVIGMCLTGNLPVAFLERDGFVQAAVLSQPSLPMFEPDALGLSRADLDRAKNSKIPMLAFRFSNDRISPWERRVAFLKELDGQIDFHVLDSTPCNHEHIPHHAHAVLTEEMFDPEGNRARHPQIRAAFETVVKYLDDRLKRGAQ